MYKVFRSGVFLVALFGTCSVAREAEACWCSRVFSRSYLDPCVSCPTIARTYYTPAAVCPTTSCATTNVQRCYYEPQTVYETRNLMVPQVSYVRRSYYDPITCCYRTYLQPTTYYSERSYQVPVTNYVRRCSVEPVTTCTTNYAPVAATTIGTEVRVQSYWSPDGYRYYPIYTPAAVDCPVPAANGASNGSSERKSEYGPGSQPKKLDAAPKNESPPPAPIPMPEKLESTPNTRRDRAPAAQTAAKPARSRLTPARVLPVRRVP